MATPLNVSELLNTLLPLIMFMLIFQMLTSIIKEFRS
jgi:hypothetical protein